MLAIVAELQRDIVVCLSILEGMEAGQLHDGSGDAIRIAGLRERISQNGSIIARITSRSRNFGETAPAIWGGECLSC
jgi:hypothetical protein